LGLKTASTNIKSDIVFGRFGQGLLEVRKLPDNKKEHESEFQMTTGKKKTETEKSKYLQSVV